MARGSPVSCGEQVTRFLGGEAPPKAPKKAKKAPEQAVKGRVIVIGAGAGRAGSCAAPAGDMPDTLSPDILGPEILLASRPP